MNTVHFRVKQGKTACNTTAVYGYECTDYKSLVTCGNCINIIKNEAFRMGITIKKPIKKSPPLEISITEKDKEEIYFKQVNDNLRREVSKLRVQNGKLKKELGLDKKGISNANLIKDLVLENDNLKNDMGKIGKMIDDFINQPRTDILKEVRELIKRY